MSYSLYCKTEQAILLLAIQRTDGMLFFATDPLSDHLPGWHFQPKSRISIHEQLKDLAEDRLEGQTAVAMDIEPRFAEVISEATTLYLARLSLEGLPDGIKVMTFAELIRRMPRDKTRIIYLKAVQAITGGFDQFTKAVETDDVEGLVN